MVAGGIGGRAIALAHRRVAAPGVVTGSAVEIDAPSRDQRRAGLVRRVAPLLAGLLLALGVAAGGVAPGSPAAPAPARAASGPTRIAMSAPATIDPAQAGDADSSAVIAQLFDGLVGLDDNRSPQPALAAGWTFADGGKTVRFTLRDNLEFSDGSPLTSADVVRSWMRVLDPAAPSPLAGLLFDIIGARAYTTGGGPASAVGITAPDPKTVEVRLDRPAADFPALAASPTLAVVPPAVGRDAAALRPGSAFVASGGYVLSAATTTEMDLVANPRYWAGPPAIASVALVNDLGGQDPVDAFSAGKLDYVPVGGSDAAQLAWDRELGSSLRTTEDLTVTYYGFDTRVPPFSDVRVRQAFAQAVDWRRVVTLADGALAVPATSMVPPGIPGRPTEDLLPPFDPASARHLLAAAGYADPTTFPTVTLVTGGTGYDLAVQAQLKANLGVTIKAETMELQAFFTRVAGADPPAFWAMGWIADYPSPNDFLGILLGTGQASNYGGWSNASFDAAVNRATSATDTTAATAAYDQAARIVQDQDPVVPISYGESYALARDGLLGATNNGMGILRVAGMAWAPGSGR